MVLTKLNITFISSQSLFEIVIFNPDDYLKLIETKNYDDVKLHKICDCKRFMLSKKINSSRIFIDEQGEKELIKTLPNKPTIYTYNNNFYGKINYNIPLNPKAKKEKIEKMNNNKKLKTILLSYNNHIKLIENKNKLLKAKMTEMQNKFINSKIKK